MFLASLRRRSHWISIDTASQVSRPLDSWASETEDEQHRLIAQFPQFRRHRVDVSCISAEPRLDSDILPPTDLKGHRRRIDAAANIELPQFFQAGVVVGRH